VEHTDRDGISIEQLIEELRIISNHRIVKSVSEWDPSSYRILDEPIDSLIISDLMSGPWTRFELADKYGLEKKDIDDILYMLIRYQDLLEYGYLARRVGWDERPGYRTSVRYTIKSVPFEARIYDPFLGCSLLNWNSLILSESKLTVVDMEKFTPIIQHLCEVWQMPFGVVLDRLEKKDTLCVQSIFGLIPFSEDRTLYENIRHSLDEDPELVQYSYFRLNFKNFINDYRALNRRDIAFMSIFDIQRYVIKLHDAITYCMYFDNTKILKKLFTQGARLFNLLFSTSMSGQ